MKFHKFQGVISLDLPVCIESTSTCISLGTSACFHLSISNIFLYGKRIKLQVQLNYNSPKPVSATQLNFSKCLIYLIFILSDFRSNFHMKYWPKHRIWWFLFQKIWIFKSLSDHQKLLPLKIVTVAYPNLFLFSSWNLSINRLACDNNVPLKLWDCLPQTSSQSEANVSTIRANTTNSFDDSRSNWPFYKKTPF